MTRLFSKTSAAVVATIATILLLLWMPTGYEGALQFRDEVKCKALILETDESRIVDTGLIRTGQQVCRIKFLSGKYKGMETEGWNMLGGSLSLDKLFHPGDKAQALVSHEGD